jgi:hypothetical protein
MIFVGAFALGCGLGWFCASRGIALFSGQLWALVTLPSLVYGLIWAVLT